MIDNPPPAPDSIPQYIVDGMHRQGSESLGAIEEYARELQEILDERDQQPLDEEQLADSGEEVVDVDQKGGWTYVKKKTPCGKDCNGCPHGPYMYRVRRKDGELEWDYPKDHPVNNSD